jgi:hypothetical protein
MFLLSNIPGPNGRISIWGHEIIEIDVSFKTRPTSFPVSIFLFSYDGAVRIKIFANNNIISSQGQLDAICKNVYKDLTEMIADASPV